MKVIMGIALGLLLGLVATTGAELLNADGSPYTMWQNGLTPQQYERQQYQDGTNRMLQQYLTQPRRGPC